MKHTPPRDELYRQADPMEALESLFRNLIANWNPESGKLIRDYIEPIIAKVYLQDLKLNKTDAMKVLGIDGTRGDKSTIDERYKRYSKLKETFNPK